MTALYAVVPGAIAQAADLNQYRDLARGNQVFDLSNGYGAVGDNVSDDTAVVLAALTAITAAGGGLLLGTGKYKVSADLPVPSNCTIVGDGGLSGFYFVDNGLAANLSLYLNGVTNVRLEGFRVTSTAVSRTGVYGLIRGSDATNVRIRGLDLDNSSSAAIWTSRCTDWVIEDCTITDCWADGLHITRESKRIRLAHNDITGCRDDAIGIASYKGTSPLYAQNEDILVEGNTISAAVTLGAGVSVVGGRAIIVRGNAIRSMVSDGINVLMTADATFHGGDHAVVTDNVIQGCARGLRTVGAKNTTVIGNVFTGSSEYGIGLLASSLDCVVTGNRSYGNTSVGLYEEVGSGPNVIVGNNLRGNTDSSLLLNGGTGSVNSGNLT